MWVGGRVYKTKLPNFCLYSISYYTYIFHSIPMFVGKISQSFLNFTYLVYIIPYSTIYSIYIYILYIILWKLYHIIYHISYIYIFHIYIYILHIYIYIPYIYIFHIYIYSIYHTSQFFTGFHWRPCRLSPPRWRPWEIERRRSAKPGDPASKGWYSRQIIILDII